MPEFAYTVYVSFADAQLPEQWLAWMRQRHLAEVLSGGAVGAELIEQDEPGPGRSFEVRYHFASRQHFEQYEREHAPRLRAEGLKLFPVEKGVAYRRATGQVLARLGPDTSAIDAAGAGV